MSAAPLLVAVHPDWYPDSAACALEKFQRRKECMPGFGPEVIDFLLDYLNIPYKIVKLSSNKTSGQRLISKTEEGSWSGVLGDIERGVYDTVAAPYIRTSDRLDSFSLTVPVDYFEAVFFVGPTQPNLWDSTLKLVTIFDPVLFGTALGTLVVILLGCLATVMIFSDKQKSSEPSKRKHHGGLLYAPEHRTAGGKAIVLIFWFTVILFSELYEGCLLSSLLVTQDNNIRMTETQLFDRVYQKKLTFIADKNEFENYGLWQSMRFDNSSKYETFQKSLIRNPPILVDSSDMKTTVNSLFEQDPDKYVLMADNMDSFFYTKYGCNLRTVETDAPKIISAAFVFRKNSSIVGKINEAINKNFEFVTAISEQYYKSDKTNCTSTDFENKMSVPPLTLLTLMGSFTVLLIGFLSALCCLMVEKFSDVFKRVIHKLTCYV